MIGFYQYLSTSIQQFQLQTDVANHTPLQHVGIVFLVHAPKTGVVKGHTSVKNESCRGGTQKVSFIGGWTEAATGLDVLFYAVIIKSCVVVNGYHVRSSTKRIPVRQDVGYSDFFRRDSKK